MNYHDLANQLGVALCPGEGVPDRDHEVGYVALHDPRVHWAERTITKPGLRNFLKLVARVKLGHYLDPSVPPWRELYQQSVWAQTVALRDLHVRLPKRYSLSDRARVKYLMGKEWVSPLETKTILRWVQGE